MRIDAPTWRSHTSRWRRAGWCTYMVNPPGFFFFFLSSHSLVEHFFFPGWLHGSMSPRRDLLDDGVREY